jgi:hypothetical protein
LRHKAKSQTTHNRNRLTPYHDQGFYRKAEKRNRIPALPGMYCGNASKTNTYMMFPKFVSGTYLRACFQKRSNLRLKAIPALLG